MSKKEDDDKIQIKILLCKNENDWKGLHLIFGPIVFATARY